MTELKANRHYKDRVFRMIFNSREKVLELYNSMNGTDYEKLFLYEQQSSKNGNMPLRCLFYVSDSYSRMVRFVKKAAPCASIVDKVRRYSENQPLEAAIEQTVDECIQEDVLRDFLLTHKAEVKKLRKV